MIRTRDVTVAALLVALMAASLATRVPTAGQHATTPLAYALLVLAAAPIATHRRWPLPSVAVAVAAVVAYSFGHFSVFPGYPLFVLVFAVGLHAEWHTATVAYATALAGLGASLLMQPAAVVTASTWISTVLALTVAWLAGENLRTRRGRWTALRERADRLERDTRQAVADERLRIARELHDVVAHSMSVIAVQAGVANHVIDSRPELAREALATVETNTRAALVEMRRLLGVLRQADEPSASLAPAPGLAEVPSLVDQLARAGLPVELRVEGARDAVPEGVDLSAFRIVQEGLTNVLRHGGPVATVTIGYPGDAVVVEIGDEGRADRRPANVATARHGIIGMRERVAVFGGQLQIGPTAGGGFRVRATLPYRPVTP